MSDHLIEWDEVSPQIAVECGLVCVEDFPVRGPVNEAGEECPWPWEPEQLGGAPMGQYHCGYCGGMQVAGLPHADWSLDQENAVSGDPMPAEFPHPRLPREAA